MGLSIAFTFALIAWLVCWAIGLQSLLAAVIAMLIALIAIATYRAITYLPANRPPR